MLAKTRNRAAYRNQGDEEPDHQRDDPAYRFVSCKDHPRVFDQEKQRDDAQGEAEPHRGKQRGFLLFHGNYLFQGLRRFLRA